MGDVGVDVLVGLLLPVLFRPSAWRLEKSRGNFGRAENRSCGLYRESSNDPNVKYYWSRDKFVNYGGELLDKPPRLGRGHVTGLSSGCATLESAESLRVWSPSPSSFSVNNSPSSVIRIYCLISVRSYIMPFALRSIGTCRCHQDATPRADC